MQAGEAGIARWRMVADGLRALIAEAPDMERLPIEAELAARFGVNRHTVRRAIATLTAEGLLRAEQGRGTFVDRRPQRLAYPVGARTRFSENITQQSREPGGRLIGASREAASGTVASALGLRPGAPVHRLETLSVADGVPLSIATNYFPAERFPQIVQAYAGSGSITEALKADGLVDYRREETRVTAERVSLGDAEALGCAADALVIVTLSVNIDPDGQPIQLSRSRFAADRIELVFRT